MRRRYRRASDVDWGDDVLTASSLPDTEKERLCRDLLAEFGVTHIRPGGDGELIHGCILPFSNHTDQDRNPTASLNYKKLTYNCLGSCQSGGGLLWLIGLVRGTSDEQARRWLSDQTDLDDEQTLAALLDYFDEVYSEKRKVEAPMPKMDPKVLEPWMVIHPYLTEIRHIPEGNVVGLKVGYGQIRMRVGEQFIDSHRIVIPHFWRGDLVGWQTRRLTKDGTPKYHNSPDLPRDRTIYNYHPKAETAVVVESPMSVLSKTHISPIEATFGAKVHDRQLRLLAMHEKVILFMDNDEAGWKATTHIGDFLQDYCPVFVADNPYAADPADLDDETYRSILSDPIPYALWKPPRELVAWEPQGT